MADGTARPCAAVPDIKFCECGCGGVAPIAKSADPRTGRVQGQPLRFIYGHWGRNKIVSAETRAKKGAKLAGAGNGSWLGGAAGYGALHTWVRKHNPKTGTCDECRRPTRTEYAIIHGRPYSRNREDYRELCRPCHMKYDLTGRAMPPASIRRGSANGFAKLTEDQVTEIREALAAGDLQRDIAARYGVSKSLISNINLRLSWTHI